MSCHCVRKAHEDCWERIFPVFGAIPVILIALCLWVRSGLLQPVESNGYFYANLKVLPSKPLCVTP